MTQEELLRRMEALVGDESKRIEREDEWRKEVRDDLSSLKAEVVGLRSEITGAGGIVGTKLCIAQHTAMTATMTENRRTCDEREADRQRGRARMLWFQGILVVAIVSVILTMLLSHFKISV